MMHDSVSFYPGELAEAKNIIRHEKMNEKMKMFFAKAIVIWKIKEEEVEEDQMINELYEESTYSFASKEALKEKMKEAITTAGSDETLMEFIAQRADQMSF